MRRLTSLLGTVTLVSAALLAFAMIREAVPAPPPGKGPSPPAKAPGPPPQPPHGGPRPGAPFAGLSKSELAQFQAGQRAFQKPATPQGGLGPVFTENACAKCHNAAAIGGAGPRLVTHFGRLVGGQFDPMIEFGGPQVQDHGIGRF